MSYSGGYSGETLYGEEVAAVFRRKSAHSATERWRYEDEQMRQARADGPEAVERLKRRRRRRWQEEDARMRQHWSTLGQSSTPPSCPSGRPGGSLDGGSGGSSDGMFDDIDYRD